MARDDPRGFVECGSLDGGISFSTRQYKIAADGRSGQFAKYPGDPVVLASGQYAARASADSSDGIPILGIIRAVYTDSGGRPKPLTFSQPTNGPVLQASVAGWVDVNVYPNQTYTANVDTTVLGTHIGQYVGVTAGAANTAAGRSGFMVKMSTATNSASVTTPFQIVNISSLELDGLTQTEPNQDVEVKIANHVFATYNRNSNAR